MWLLVCHRCDLMTSATALLAWSNRLPSILHSPDCTGADTIYCVLIHDLKAQADCASATACSPTQLQNEGLYFDLEPPFAALVHTPGTYRQR